MEVTLPLRLGFMSMFRMVSLAIIGLFMAEESPPERKLVNLPSSFTWLILRLGGLMIDFRCGPSLTDEKDCWESRYSSLYSYSSS